MSKYKINRRTRDFLNQLPYPQCSADASSSFSNTSESCLSNSAALPIPDHLSTSPSFTVGPINSSGSWRTHSLSSQTAVDSRSVSVCDETILTNTPLTSNCHSYITPDLIDNNNDLSFHHSSLDVSLSFSELDFSSSGTDVSFEANTDDEADLSDVMSPTKENIIESPLGAIFLLYKLPRECVRDVAILIRDIGHDIHVDRRTILKTPRSKPQFQNFHHFGIRPSMLRRLKKGLIYSVERDQPILLDTFIDGIPLDDCNDVNFWMVLGRIHNAIDKTPFVISAFCGEGKPPCIDSFLNPLIEDIDDLQNNGIRYNNHRTSILVNAIIADKAGRDLCKGTRSHVSKSGCDRCSVVGVKYLNRMTFAVNNLPP